MGGKSGGGTPQMQSFGQGANSQAYGDFKSQLQAPTGTPNQMPQGGIANLGQPAVTPAASMFTSETGDAGPGVATVAPQAVQQPQMNPAFSRWQQMQQMGRMRDPRGQAGLGQGIGKGAGKGGGGVPQQQFMQQQQPQAMAADTRQVQAPAPANRVSWTPENANGPMFTGIGGLSAVTAPAYTPPPIPAQYTNAVQQQQAAQTAAQAAAPQRTWQPGMAAPHPKLDPAGYRNWVVNRVTNR